MPRFGATPAARSNSIDSLTTDEELILDMANSPTSGLSTLRELRRYWKELPENSETLDN